jgi:hypothetical protein
MRNFFFDMLLSNSGITKKCNLKKKDYTDKSARILNLFLSELIYSF